MKRSVLLLLCIALLGCSCGKPADDNTALTPGDDIDKSLSSITASLSGPPAEAAGTGAAEPLPVNWRAAFFINDSLIFDKGRPTVDLRSFNQATEQTDDADKAIIAAQSSSVLNTIDPKMMATIDPERPVIALTFDDGPGPYTEQILDILAANGARATFFVVGNRIKAYPEVMADIVAQGSEIGNHSWSHAYLTKLDEQGVREQLQWTVDEVEKATGVKPTLLRPPYGSLNDSVLGIIKEMGMPIITWSIDTLDWSTKDPHKTYDSIMGSVTNGCIILCHDIHEETAEAMLTVVPDLVKAGYQLVTVSEMLALINGGAIAGTVYRSVTW